MPRVHWHTHVRRMIQPSVWDGHRLAVHALDHALNEGELMQALRLAVLTLAILLAGCTPAATSPSGPANQPAPSPTQRVLTASVALEPGFIAGLSPIPARNATDFYQRIFNAFLDLYDDQQRPLPYLAEALPALNTDSWQVFPDGTMQTRYHLKPTLVWHDGAPLVADDFVFSYQVATPANGFRTAVAPFTLMGGVTAPDERTIVIQWK